jgi:protoporphyrinogen/coproporphyrinogen III oxidase
MASIAIVGGGLAGLTAAHAVRAERHDVQVLEAGREAGGVVRTVREGGFLADLGPSSMMVPPPLVMSLFMDLNLLAERVDANPLARQRYVVRGGRPCAVPRSPMSLLATPLLSLGAKLRLLTEPLRRAPPPSSEESLTELVRRRLGQEVVDYLLNPVAAGVYAGDPDQLSAIHAMPSIGALEARYGSLVGGGLHLLKGRKHSSDEPEGRLFSFREGMATIPRALARRLGSALRLNTRVTRIARLGAGWSVTSRGPNGTATQQFDAVICAAPSHAFPRIDFNGEDAGQWTTLADLHYAPVAVVVSGFARRDVAHPLDGFGVLVPAVEQGRTLGTLFSSALFPGRAPDGFVTLTTFLGGERQPEMLGGDEASLLAATDADLRELVGSRGTPVFRRVQQYPHAIPQYQVGYGRLKAAGDALERANPGFVLAGSHRNGVALSDVMMSGLLAAQETCAALGPLGRAAGVAG